MVVNRLQKGLINLRIAPRVSRPNCQNILFQMGIIFVIYLIRKQYELTTEGFGPDIAKLHTSTIITLMGLVSEIRSIVVQKLQSFRYILGLFAAAPSVDMIECKSKCHYDCLLPYSICGQCSRMCVTCGSLANYVNCATCN
jgi:hypothetical protein